MQKRNQYQNIEDFLNDESFRLWVLHNVNHKNWEEWTLESHSRAKLVEDARLWIIATKVEEAEISKNEIQKALENTWKKIELVENTKHNSKLKFLKSSWFRATAAVLVFGLIVTAIYKTNNNFINVENPTVYTELVSENSEGLVEQTNNSENPQIITLSDGSSVLLQPNSKLSYPKSFLGNDRKVYLSGEAFFEISKNPKKPFLVFANEIITKVVGTSFRVSAYENQPNVEVTVRTGKVKISSNKNLIHSSEEEIVLLPNQAMRFERKNSKFDKITNLTKDSALKQKESDIEQLSFEFTDIPVDQIFKTLEQAYSINIDFPKEKLKNCHLTTSLNDQPLPGKLKIICKSLGNNTNYEMNGNQIIITSEGCN